jgi:hypothetical protein
MALRSIGKVRRGVFFGGEAPRAKARGISGEAKRNFAEA